MIGSMGMPRLARTGAVIAALCCGVTTAASADGRMTLAWARQLGTGGPDWAASVATDTSGNVYLAGYTAGSLGGAYRGGGWDAWVAKYDAYGRPVWKRHPATSGNDTAQGVATDASGNVYVTGWTTGTLGDTYKGGWDAWVRKYDASGRLLWTRQPGTGRDDVANAVATDAAGDVYVAGIIGDSCLVKYDPSGRVVWRRQPGRTGSPYDRGVATGVTTGADADGDVYVYVAGYTWGSIDGANRGGEDAWVAKYDTAGEVIWVRQLGSKTEDAATAVATDTSGDVYVAGYTYGSLPGAKKGLVDAWVAKYDPTGEILWQRQPGTSTDDYALGLATDAAGDVYVAGYTDGSLAGSNRGGNDAWVRKYDPAGGLLWQRQPGTDNYDRAEGVATDAAGNVFLVGLTFGSLAGGNRGERDAFLLKFSPSE